MLLGRELQKQVSALDPSVQVQEGELLAARLEKMLTYPRFRAALLACFAVGALLLASVGLHGVLLQLVAQRIPEIWRPAGGRGADLGSGMARRPAGRNPGFRGIVCWPGVLAGVQSLAGQFALRDPASGYAYVGSRIDDTYSRLCAGHGTARASCRVCRSDGCPQG